MWTKKYPDLHLISRPVMINGAWRIIPKEFINSPLGTGDGVARFNAPNFEYKILYAASYLQTAIRATLVRDDFDNNKERILLENIVDSCASVVIDSTEPLNLLDLNDGKPNSIGVPSDIRHSKNYDLSRAFALEVFLEMPEIDGFYYQSRLDDKICFAIFERSVALKLRVNQTLLLANTPNFRITLKSMRMKYKVLDL